MASEPDEAFIRNYFAGYERENGSFGNKNYQVQFFLRVRC